LFDHEKRFAGGYAIVGETYPVAIGIAYAIARRSLPEAVICFFGDGAVNQGTFHESLNMAALWQLPVLFVCENNRYQIGTEIHRHSAVTDIYKRACGYQIPAEQVDGMDVLAVHQATHAALDRIREGTGPQFLEMQTYRFRGHSMADPGSYRPKVEVQAFEGKDPVTIAVKESMPDYPSPEQIAAAGPDNIGQLTEHIHREGHMTPDEVAILKQEVAATVDAAVAFASNSPEPTIDDAWNSLYCNRGHEVLI